uniref:Reverse transcriptase domain-containing protein n=1 Tax=Brassica campestris TaxID=3711 RepID=M4EYE7_BRACM
MAYRSSRLEKGKWIPGPSNETRRPPIRLPQGNSAALIEEHKFTLIGRVTNPKIQKTRALVDFFLQHWRGRIRVLINGLKPLEMKLDVVSPSGEIKQVELEYEDLEKHCFICFSLEHDKDDCPTQRAQVNLREHGPRMGISQSRTLARLDADRQRADERRRARTDGSQWLKPSGQEIDWKQDKSFRYNYGARRDPNFKPASSFMEGSKYNNRRPARERLSCTRDTEISGSRDAQSRQNFQTPRAEWRPVASGSQRGDNAKVASQSLASHTPLTRSQREGGSKERTGTPAGRQISGERSGPSHERCSALNRLSLPKERFPLLQDGVANTESGRLQEVDPQLKEQAQFQRSKSIPSSSRILAPIPNMNYDASQERSPIRTLSEDRVHVSLRLGPLFDSEEEERLDLQMNSKDPDAPAGTGSIANRTRKRGQRSPTQGTTLKKRRVTKTNNSPRRNLSKVVGKKAGSKGAGTSLSADRPRFWEIMTEIGVARTAPWLLTGDFNDLLDNSEKVGGPLRWEGSFLAFRNFVSTQGLWDLQFSGNSLSWRGTRYSHFIQSRLDRTMANIEWMEMFPAARSEYLRFEGSDHRPLVTHFDQNLTKKKGAFRYDRRLSGKPEIRDLVEATWKEPESVSLLSKINNVRRKLIEWAKSQAAATAEHINSHQVLLEQALSDSNPDTDRIAALKEILETAYAEEEAFWRQRSRIQWLSGGDRNSSYFHAVTRGRRACNKFSIIEDETGASFYEEDQIVKAFVMFYQLLFTTGNTDPEAIVAEALSPKVTLEMNQSLIEIPDKLEVQQAVFSIHPDKAPGPDGFSADFYRTFWDVIGDDVYRDIRGFFETSVLSPRQNETHIRLIPKGTGAKSVSDFRPIALCNTHYKIIAKILSKRLQPVLHSLISPSQSAFVPGRAISDNVLITHEVLHYLRKSGARKHVSMAVKTDMSKAYDRIEWNFLRAVLQRLGFHETWTDWVMECVSSVSYSFLINGGPQGKVSPTRGLRQGDPLSPYLFILCTEVLSGLCNKALEIGTLPGVKVGRHCPPINHLLFADDTMFFGKSNAASCSTLLSILKKYEMASGQCINRAKSAITFSSKTSQECKSRVKRELNICSEGGIGKYLGLPEHFGRKKRDIFSSIVDRIRQRGQSWTSRYLSGAGKMVLLKAVLAAMPTYTMSCFKLPVSLCKQIQSVLTRFWWDVTPEIKKMSWISWDRLTYPKSAGGLGFREIEVFNDALLAKHTWRLLKNPSSLLGRILLNKYCHDSDLLTCSAPNSSSHGWREILAGRDIIKKGMGWNVGSGRNIKVWSDKWLATDSQLCPIGPPTESDRELRVSDLMMANSTDWNVEEIRRRVPVYEAHIRKLVPSEEFLEDEVIWLLEKSGNYSTKSGYALAKVHNGSQQDTFNWKRYVWNVQCSPKLRHFLWKLKNNALAVGEALVKRGMQVDGMCKRCGVAESLFHVMYACPTAQKVWELVPGMGTPTSGTATTMEGLLMTCERMKNLPPTGLLTPLYPWIFWVLWTSRNQLRFEDKSFSETEMVTRAITAAKEWQTSLPSQKHCSVSPKDCQISTPLPQVPANVYTLCTDAAWNGHSFAGGLGWVCTDSSGINIFQGTETRRYIASALVAEALAMKAGLQKAISSGCKDLICCSDSKSLIEAITGNKTVAALRGILHDLGVLSSSFSSISFRFISRSCNEPADRLAKRALFLFSNNLPEIENSVLV